ncbi:MAG: glycoside hydrolase family 43 protein [Bacteroidaceae bacterium]|nr:glycoside hydrolase family 43 protein [Bacteroidaceae bacterium]
MKLPFPKIFLAVWLMSAALFSCTKVQISNPVIPGWYADPEGIVFNGEVWIYPTLSLLWGDDTLRYAKDLQRTTPAWNQEYNLQTHIDAFSSKDLVHWTKHPAVLSVENVPWVSYAMWAPAIVKNKGKYYLFFSGNDIQNNEQTGGIGVAIADKPEGPFRDVLGHPLIGQIVNGAQPIDQYVFRDDDGSWYMYYGGWRHCNMVRLSDDLTQQIAFDDGDMFKEVTPKGYVEGPFMLKRKGKYYFMWSEGGWTGPDYHVAYAIADSPFGPFNRVGTILEQDSTVATGAGHHSVIRHPRTHDYYIVYHRRPLGRVRANERQVCIDKLEFDADGFIKPVKMTKGSDAE